MQERKDAVEFLESPTSVHVNIDNYRNLLDALAALEEAILYRIENDEFRGDKDCDHCVSKLHLEKAVKILGLK